MLTRIHQAGAGFTSEDGHKNGLFALELGLAGIILDAELTLPTPERLWSVLVPGRDDCSCDNTDIDLFRQAVDRDARDGSRRRYVQDYFLPSNSKRSTFIVDTETLYRPGISHPVKVLCYAAIADLFKFLPLSKANPDNVEYRSDSRSRHG